MKKHLLLFLLIVKLNIAFSQAFFTSSASGDWTNPSKWTLVSGTSTLNYPASGDSVIIQSAHAIQLVSNVQCQSVTVKGAATLTINNNTSTLTVTNDLLITETSGLDANAGLLTVTGNLTVNQKSTITQNGGAISVFGLIFLNAPSANTGSTTLDVQGGAFNCIGGMTITATTIPAGRVAELKIGNSAVNIAGALTTISANAKITFTGNGALTLAGAITIPNASSFTAGNGRVVYVGLPGLDQTIAALTYNRLVITGIGNGIKTINGNVIVTDTLTLLSDTLQINGAGTLKLNANATIVKTAGKLISTPLFLGQIDILYNDVQKDTTGLEMPIATNILRNLFINNIAGVKLSASITVNNKLSLQNGELFTDNFILNINNPLGGTTTDPAVERVNGYVNGKINRTIGASTGIRVFPFGIGLAQGYRECKIEYTTAPSTPGTLIFQHFNMPASAQSGLPLNDVGVTIVNTAPYYWQADALAGLSGGVYNLTLTAEGTPGVTNVSTLRILKRPSTGGSWTLNGTAGTNSGTNASPIVVRNGMPNFSQFTVGGDAANTLPLTLISFTGTERNGNILLNWKVSNETGFAYYSVEQSSDAISFFEVGKVYPSRSSSVEKSYQFTIYNLQADTYFYRLKMVDVDGKVNYSRIISLKVEKYAGLYVYPTISNTIINVVNKDGLQVTLFNEAGQLIKSLHSGTNDISDLTSGYYFVKAGKEVVKIYKY